MDRGKDKSFKDFSSLPGSLCTQASAVIQHWNEIKLDKTDLDEIGGCVDQIEPPFGTKRPIEA